VGEKKYRRHFDLSEKAWLSYQLQGRPQAYMMIIEGSGDVSDKEMMQALQKVSLLYPVSHSTLTGCLNHLRWESSDKFPSYLRLPSTDITFDDLPLPMEKEIYWNKIDVKKESPIAVYTLSNGRKRRIYIKIHHTAMDGMGLAFFVADVFKAMRGEAPVGGNSEFDDKNDLFAFALPDDFFRKKRPPPAKDRAKAPKGSEKKGGSILINDVYVGGHIISPPPTDNHFEWQCLSVPFDETGTSSLNGKILSTIIDMLLKTDPELHKKKFQACIPVDLRYLKPGLRNASNLSGIVMLELEKYIDLPFLERAERISNDLRKEVNSNSAVLKTPRILNWIPIWVMSLAVFVIRKVMFFRKKYPYYFFFSNIGKWALNDLSTDTFTAERVYDLPNMQFCCPFFLLVSAHDNGMELLCATDTDKDALAHFVQLLKTEIASIKKKN